VKIIVLFMGSVDLPFMGSDFKIYKYIRAMINNPHPKGTKKYKKWNKVILILLIIGIVMGFVIKSIKNIYY